MTTDKRGRSQEGLRQSNAESNRITKESLQLALIYLMEQKPFEKITITELAQKAGVSRTAFYRNYDSKEGLLQEICTGITRMLRQSLRSQQFLTAPIAWYAQWFQTIQDNAAVVRLLGKANLFEDSIRGTKSLLEETFPSDSPEQHYCYVTMEGALFAVVSHWLAGGMEESVAFMADFCTRLHAQVFSNSGREAPPAKDA